MQRAGIGGGRQPWTAEQRWLAALLAAVGLTLIASAGLPLGPLQVLSGALAILCAPGYALLLAVRPRRLPFVNRLVLSVPLSLAIVIICALALNASPLGVHQRVLAALACGVTLALLAVASRRNRADSAQTLRRWREGLGAITKRQPRSGAKALKVVALAIVATLITAGGFYAATRPIPTYYTAFSIASAVPSSPQTATLRLDIANQEQGQRRYLVRITRVPGVQSAKLVGTAPDATDSEITLAPGTTGTVEATVAFACGDAITADLWLADDPAAGQGTPYRLLRALPDCIAGTPTAP